MQATRQNTRQLAALQSETLEWWAGQAGRDQAQWSICNYGPGILWFNYSGGQAAPGANDSSNLRKGFSFTDSVSARRYMEISLVAEAPLTYVLDTNQRIGAAGIGEAPIDGQVYGRRDGLWIRGAGPAQSLPFAPGWFSGGLGYRTLHFGDQLEVFGTIVRLSNEPVTPGTIPTLMGTFPLGYRPMASIQYQLAIGAPPNTVGQFHAVALTLQPTGQLSVYVPLNTQTFYLNQLFNLTTAF